MRRQRHDRHCTLQLVWASGVDFTAIALPHFIISYIAGVPAHCLWTPRPLNLVVVVPPIPENSCRSSSLILVFGHSGSHGNWQGERWGARVKHWQMAFIMGLANIPAAL